jgi:hypothetical protein
VTAAAPLDKMRAMDSVGYSIVAAIILHVILWIAEEFDQKR